jgi:hypothetical protein
MRGAITAVVSCSTLLACGGSALSTPPAVARVAPEPSSVPASPPPLVVEYVLVHRRWVEKVVPTTAAEVKSWSEAPENAEAVPVRLRQIVIKAPKGKADEAAARRKAQALLDRIGKGEDFGKLAKEHPDETTSSERSDDEERLLLSKLPEPVRTAYQSLKPAETAKDVVRSDVGFHIVRKERASEESLERAYKKAKAPALTRRLGDELLARMKVIEESRRAIAEAVEAVLGERATNDADRPTAAFLDRDRVKQVRIPAAAKAALETFAASAHPGDLFPSPAIDGDTVLVARALSPGAR